jgi:hypothetical protein
MLGGSPCHYSTARPYQVGPLVTTTWPVHVRWVPMSSQHGASMSGGSLYHHNMARPC